MITNCKEISNSIKEEIKNGIKCITESVNKCRKPCLAVIICGEDTASKVYVRNKHKACENVGIESINIEFPEDVSQEKLIGKISQLNEDRNVDGILVQLPLPEHINKDTVINSIDPLKDVDGFTPSNMGSLYSGNPLFTPCTPLGVMKIFEYYNYNLKGKNVTIVGRSNNVGFPLFKLILDKDATPTLCHSKTKNLKEHLLNSDVIISAAGCPNLITSDMVKEGTFIIDISINRINTPNSEKGYKLVGDVDFDNVKDKCSYITPVPGGVGLMTVSMLLYNTFIAFKMNIHDEYAMNSPESYNGYENKLIMSYDGNSLYELSNSIACDGVPHDIIKNMFPSFEETSETFTKSYFIVDKHKNVIYE